MAALSVVCFNCGTRAGQLGGQPGQAREPGRRASVPRTFLLGLCGGGALVLTAALVYARLS